MDARTTRIHLCSTCRQQSLLCHRIAAIARAQPPAIAKAFVAATNISAAAVAAADAQALSTEISTATASVTAFACSTGERSPITSHAVLLLLLFDQHPE